MRTPGYRQLEYDELGYSFVRSQPLFVATPAWTYGDDSLKIKPPAEADVVVLFVCSIPFFLKYTIFTRNESLPRTVMEHVQRLQPNIENALAHLISTHHEAAANKTSPKRKGIPEWGIVLVIIAMVTTAIIGIRQAHKHCGTKTSVKPKELMEEHDNPEAAPNALPNVPLNFTNPIYVQP